MCNSFTDISVSMKQCPTGEQIFRFLDVMSRRTTTNLIGKMVPSLATIKHLWKRLISYLTFHHQDLRKNYNAYWVTRISTNLDQLAAQKLLIRGRWRKAQWLGFRTLHTMARAWVESALRDGCPSWDLVLLRLLGVVLLASCTARAGDVARTGEYTGMECLCWKHVEMTVQDPSQSLSVQNLRLKITLEYTKGHKYALPTFE